MKRLRSIAGALVFLYAASAALGSPLTVQELVSAVTRESPEYLRNQALLAGYSYDYLASRASLAPTIGVSMPVTLSDAFRQVLSGGIELTGNYDLAVGPTVSVSQLLPTAGVLTASVTDRLKVDGLRSVDPPTYESTYPPGTRYANELSVSAGLTQPLYFGAAYDAARRMIEGTRLTGEIRSASGRNSVLIQAITDYYSLKRFLYSISLVRSRIEADRGNLDRMEKELSLGRGTQATVLGAKAALLKSETDLLEAQLTYDTSFRRFRAAYGLKDSVEMDPAVLALEIPAVDADAAVEAATSANPSVRSARVLAELKRAEMITAAKDHAPTLQVQASFTIGDGLGDYDILARSMYLTAGVEAKLGDGGAFKNAMKRRAAELEEQESALRSALVQAEADVRAAADVLTHLEKLHELYLLQEDVAEAEHQRVAKNRELGNATDSDVRDALLDLEAVRMTIQQNTIDRNLTFLRLLAVQGVEVAGALPKEHVQ